MAEAPAAAVVASASEAGGESGVLRTVQVVEDDESVRGTIVRMLERGKPFTVAELVAMVEEAFAVR